MAKMLYNTEWGLEDNTTSWEEAESEDAVAVQVGMTLGGVFGDPSKKWLALTIVEPPDPADIELDPAETIVRVGVSLSS